MDCAARVGKRVTCCHCLTYFPQVCEVGPSCRRPLPAAVQRELVPRGREQTAHVQAVEE